MMRACLNWYGEKALEKTSIDTAIASIGGVSRYPGKVKALAVTTERRSIALPDVPTVVESGVPGFDVPVWYGVSVPKGTPREVVDKLSGTINKLLVDPGFKKQLTDLGVQPVVMSPLEWSGAVRLDLRRWELLVRLSNMAA